MAYVSIVYIGDQMSTRGVAADPITLNHRHPKENPNDTASVVNLRA
jgi:hypothetical protein